MRREEQSRTDKRREEIRYTSMYVRSMERGNKAQTFTFTTERDTELSD
jgi:hypothetical protein